MHFLPNVYVTCDECHGKRYNRETLEIKFKDKSIADVLNLTVSEAVEFFRVEVIKIADWIIDLGLQGRGAEIEYRRILCDVFHLEASTMRDLKLARGFGTKRLLNATDRRISTMNYSSKSGSDGQLC
jgi:hypothetical protein